jgi:hypothetical protein
MKVPDLAGIDDAAVVTWTGATEPLHAAARHAHLKFANVDFSHVADRTALFKQLDSALKLPDHFGHNWDALADVFEDRDWLGSTGRVTLLAHTAAYRREHPTDWGTLEDILAEAAEFWKERNVAFWVFVA